MSADGIQEGGRGGGTHCFAGGEERGPRVRRGLKRARKRARKRRRRRVAWRESRVHS